jgi:hypothetical protein
MPILYFSDVLKKVGLDPTKVLLIRHAMTHKGFRACHAVHMDYEYTRHQTTDFSRGYDYWVTFVSDKGTLCKLQACYKVGDYVPDNRDVIPENLPAVEAKEFQGKKAYFDLQPMDLLKDYEGRLMIDWGNSARMWHQKGTNEKPIVAIQADEKKVFTGFENLILSYDELKEIIENEPVYEAWYAAMSSVNAIYLITDRATGTQYVGSAYNQNGLLGRWKVYIETGGHGGNKKMMAVMQETPARCHDLQFSVLQILPKNMTPDEIINVETLWKDKFLTKKFGWNDN